MQEPKQLTDEEKLYDAFAHFIVSVFVIHFPKSINKGELSKARDLYGSSGLFLRDRGYETDKVAFVELTSSPHDFLRRNSDATIPNTTQGLICTVRAEKICEIFEQHYPAYFHQQNPAH